MSTESAEEKEKVYSPRRIYTEEEKNKNENSHRMSTESDSSNGNDINNMNDQSNGKYPKYVFLIILNEFCERFSYYGIRTVMFIFLTSNFLLNEALVTYI